MAGWWIESGFLGKGLVLLGTGAAIIGATYLMRKYFPEYCIQNKEPANSVVSRVTDSHGNKVLVLGLDGSGKSSLLAALSRQDQATEVQPTQGFNVMCIQTEDVSLNVWEIGGNVNMRKYWSNFIPEAGVLVFVIDSANKDRFAEAKEELYNLLNDPRVKRLPLLIVANKQDLPDARSTKELYMELLNDLNNMPSVASVQGTSTQVPPGGNLDGLDLLQTLLIDLSS